MRPDLKNRYTDAPTLQRNLLSGSVRLLFWLFFHPAAWRNHLARIDDSLPPDFSLVDLSREHWRKSGLWQFLIMTYLAWPLLIGLLSVAILILLGFPLETVALGLMLGVSTAVTTALIASIAGSVAASVPVGLAVGLVVGVGGGLIFSSPGDITLYGRFYAVSIVLSAMLGLMSGLAGGLSYGVSMGITRERREADVSVSLLRQVSGLVIGVFIGVGAGLISTLLDGRLWLSLITGIMFGVAVAWRTGKNRRGVVAGLLISLVVILTNQAVTTSIVDALLESVALLAFLAAAFALPYVLATRVAGAWAGGLAGALGSGAGLFLLITDAAAFAPFLSFSLAGILLGLTLAWWRPVLMYPFLVAWNSLLFRLDETRLLQPDAAPAFRFHSAFWDEFQLLPLLNLDDYLLALITADLAEGRTAMAYVSTTRQRWAAQEAQIELDARRLEACETVTAVATVHPGLATGDLTGPASALLRSFSRISLDVGAALEQESAYNQRLALNAIEDRLDGLLRELTRSNEPYAERFRPIAAHWRQLLAQTSRALAEEAELRQEIDSPYIIGVPLTEKQEIFIGRTDISARIEQLLLDRRQPPLLLYGQRRVGKTSLLNNLGRLLPSTIVPLFVDLQGPASRAQDEAGFLYNFARSMIQSAKRQRGMALPPLTRPELAADPFTVFEEWLDGVEAALAGQLALLMLDEFEALESVLAKSRFDEEIVLGMLRHLIQHRPQFKVLLSGSHTLTEFQRWSSYLINVQVVRIGYLNENEARQLIEAPVQNFALRYEAAASQRVLDLTHGHPFLVQLLCAEIVALKNEQPPARRRLATVVDVETAVPEALAHGSFFFADIRQNQVDEAGLALLEALAERPLPQSALAEKVGLETAVLDQTLQQLQQRELIELQDKCYRFQVDLIRRWFASS